MAREVAWAESASDDLAEIAGYIAKDGEWRFSTIDVVEVLMGGDRPRKYWNDLKKKLLDECYDQVSEIIGQLKCGPAMASSITVP